MTTAPAQGAPQRDTPPETRRVAIMGSTGSVGTQPLRVIEHLNALCARGVHPTRYEVVALVAGRNARVLAAQADAHPGAVLGLCDAGADPGPLESGRLIHASDAATRVLDARDCDLVVASIVGIAGLPSTLRAAELGLDIALANKESLVAAGSLVTGAARRSGARLLPIDSEHAGLWQCVLALTAPDAAPPMDLHGRIDRVTLTASGGALRDLSDADYARATAADALDHPTWDMGDKVTIDCATLMNKGLELIEAHHLFGIGADKLDAVIHPQSIVHALVRTRDASVLAHLGPTDMRCPIQHALTHPARCPAAPDPIDLTTIGSLDFRPIDPQRHPSIGLALRAIALGDGAGAVLNAANEVAARAFMRGDIALPRIASLAREMLDGASSDPVRSLDDALAIDERTRRVALERLGEKEPGTKEPGAKEGTAS